jgi:serine/threonine-protein kinase RsbW
MNASVSPWPSLVTSPEGTVTSAVHRFAPVPSSVAWARRFVVEQLPEHGRHNADEIILMVSELATNAVQHAAAAFDVSVTVDPIGSLVRVEVRDPSETTPALADVVDDSPGGRGLSIVATLADAWGIEMRRGRPGKTVWFTAGLPVVPDLPDELLPEGNQPAPKPVWPGRGVRAVLDGLSDAVIATDARGSIVYANAAAEDLSGWSADALKGRNATDLVPDALMGTVGSGLAEFLQDDAPEVIGRRLPTVIKRADGTEIDTDLVLSVVQRPGGGRVVLGIFRARDDRRVQRWSELTSELLETLADAPIDDPPAERLLSTLGRRLGWDVTTLWALSADHELVCRHVWTRTASTAPAFAREKADDPRSGCPAMSLSTTNRCGCPTSPVTTAS